MDTVAAAESFLEGLAAEVTGGGSSHSADVPTPDQPSAQEQMNGVAPPPAEQSTPAADGNTSGRRKRNRWGPAPAGDGQQQGGDGNKPPEKKRRSRWEEVPETTTDTTLALIPKEIVIAGGIKVCWRPKLSRLWISTGPWICMCLLRYLTQLACNFINLYCGTLSGF